MLSYAAREKMESRKLGSFDWLKDLRHKDFNKLFAEMHPRPKFHTPPMLHQKAGFVAGLITREFMFNFDMGVGKTNVPLYIYDYLKSAGTAKLPLLLLAEQAPHIPELGELCREHFPHLKTLELEGSTTKRWATLDDNPDVDIIIINYAGLVYMCSTKVRMPSGKGGNKPRLVPDYAKVDEFASRVSMVAFDESSVLQHRRTLVFRIAVRIGHTCMARFALSGTPFGKDPQPLWGQFYAIDKGKTLGPTLTLFRTAYFEQEDDYWQRFKYTINKASLRRLRKAIKNRSIYYDASECIDLPKARGISIPLKFPEETTTYYERFVMDFVKAEGKYKVQKNIFHRLRQVASGYVTVKDDAGNKEYVHFNHNPKLERTISIIKNMPKGRKCVVFHDYIYTGKLISEALREAGIKNVRLYGGTKDKRGVLRTFKRNRRCRVLVANNRSAAKMLNLQVANYSIFYEVPTDPKVFTQAKRRTRRKLRRGQKKRTVFYYYLKVQGTVDYKVYRYLRQGQNLFNYLMRGKENIKDED
jgi:hypothetical protein